MKSNLFDTLPVSPPSHQPFADRCYLQQVINHLASTRRQKRLGLREVARRSGLKLKTLSRAEKEGIVPASREFRAWAEALGFSWEQVWTFSLPSQKQRVCFDRIWG
ncbi:MAG: XRE family transcriptional regulator [Alphaproteobacteria bacterium]|nr:MAG: XRE family transcriptional regulator [Alphaproteobacteria bacterium]